LPNSKTQERFGLLGFMLAELGDRKDGKVTTLDLPLFGGLIRKLPRVCSKV
jgi:hypothetical protein